MQTAKPRNLFVDLYKILLAVFVIFIHFMNPRFTIEMHAIIRIAIAGFASITGFYIFKKNSTYEERLEKAKKFLISSLKYFGIAVVFAFSIQLIYTWIMGVPTIDGIRSFWYEIAPFLHQQGMSRQINTVIFQLWYLQGLVLISAIYLLLVWLKADAALFGLPLLVIPLCWAQTKWPLTQNPANQALYRNSILMILPSFAGGWIAGHFRETKFKWYVYPILIAVLGGLFSLQIFAHSHCPIELTFVAVLIGPLIILLLDKIPRFSCKPFYWVFGTHFYAIVYFIHLFVGNILAAKFDINPWDKSGLLILYTFLTAIVITQIYNLIKFIIKLVKQRKLKTA